jgi:hypothetical protein
MEDPDMTTLEFKAGDIISDGTLRTADLVGAFYGALVQATYSMNDSGCFALKESARIWLAADRTGNDDSDHHDIGWDLIGKLMDELNEFAPYGCYFGSNPGDGACYGFWQVDDESESNWIPTDTIHGPDVD